MIVDLHLATSRPESFAAPLATFAASSLADLDEHPWREMPEYTLSGVVCGGCTDDFRRSGLVVTRDQRPRHASAKHVQRCTQVSARWEEEVRAEMAAEAAVERFFEDRGYDEARAQETYEANLGINY